MLKIVLSNTQSAAYSWPSPRISDRLRTTDATGQALIITNAVSIMGSKGRIKVIDKAANGIISCFTKIAKYADVFMNMRLNFTVDNLMPRTNIQSGVLRSTHAFKAVCKMFGSFIPNIKRGNEINRPIVAGLRNIFLILICFLSPEIISDPKVKAMVFMAIENTAE